MSHLVNLTDDAEATVDIMAAAMGVSAGETVRRGLSVLKMILALEDDEEIVIRNKRTRRLDRIRWTWDQP